MTNKELRTAWNVYSNTATPRKNEEDELHCIQMIHSILIYHYRPDQERFPFPADNRYLQEYIKQLGVERVSQLWGEQAEDYRNAEVGFAGYDVDGCSYNYCKWADD